MLSVKLLIVVSITSLSVSLINIFLTCYFKKRYNRKVAILKMPQPYHYDCIFTTSNNSECVEHVYKNLSCGDRCSNVYLKTILTKISSAKNTISLCMYHLTLESIGGVILEAHKNNVIVRIITDYEMTFATGSQVNILKSNGIEVKTPSQSADLLHHKLCLIDENSVEAKVLFGSMNYTIQGLCHNWDHIVYTDDLTIIKKFSVAFEDLWKNIS